MVTGSAAHSRRDEYTCLPQLDKGEEGRGDTGSDASMPLDSARRRCAELSSWGTDAQKKEVPGGGVGREE